MKANMIILAQGDNVGIALRDIGSDETAFDKAGNRLSAREKIPQGHKIALTEIAAGEPVIRFKMPVARATKTINIGMLVHMHNVESQYLNNEHDHYE